jgi:hypothetical protein
LGNAPLAPYGVNTRGGFVRITLRGQDFQHARYPFVLARQMMAFGRFPDHVIAGAVYRTAAERQVITFEDTILKARKLKPLVGEARQSAVDTTESTQNTVASAEGNDDREEVADAAREANKQAADTEKKTRQLEQELVAFEASVGGAEVVSEDLKRSGAPSTRLEVVIPKEPYTPVIKTLSVDYTAEALRTDITLYHLYPFAHTYLEHADSRQTTLLPTFSDQEAPGRQAPIRNRGNLFIGLHDLVPGSNLHLLFQLAEATADSDLDRETVRWYYLRGNEWVRLRPGFDVLADETNGLVASGVVKVSVPPDITRGDHTVMPAGLYWLKAAVAGNPAAVSETIGVHARAARATFNLEPGGDTSRLAEPLPAGSIGALVVTEPAIASVQQPYEGFGGRPLEAPADFYARVSEHLRHKGRAIAPFDYERLVLDAFPELSLVRCISATAGFSHQRHAQPAPGCVTLVVMPDVTKLKLTSQFKPKTPVSVLERVKAFLRSRTSPFVRLSVMNPEYKEVDIDVEVAFMPGKDERFYSARLAEELRVYLTPWFANNPERVALGNEISRSDVLLFIERLDYVDYVAGLTLAGDARGKVSAGTAWSVLVPGQVYINTREPVPQ